MDNISFRQRNSDAEDLVNKYSAMLFRLCFTMLGNNADAEDAASEVFLKYLSCKKSFTDEEHKKAWLLKTATNTCRDMLRFYKIRRHINLGDIAEYCPTQDDVCILTELLALPEKYRTIIHLHYIEGYTTAEIAAMLSISPAAARKRLQYGREILKIEYRKDVLS